MFLNHCRSPKSAKKDKWLIIDMENSAYSTDV